MSGDTWSGALEPELAIPGVTCRALRLSTDERGWFLKVFQASALAGGSAETGVAEVYLSSSSRGVVRGLHFQVPPHDHAKTVACVAGSALDVAVDLRTGSPTEGGAARFRLDARAPAQLHLPRGIAHGFQALEDGTVLAYLVSSEHAPDHDRGVRWDSVGVDWPLDPPTVSPRDRALPALAELRSPFAYTGP